FEPRPANSLIFHPLRYIHLEGLLLGAAAIPVTGGFVPLPIDSILGTVDKGGWGEFWGTVDKSLDEDEVVTASVPASLGVEGEDILISTVTQTTK
ncbi:MAG TPA: hypothetical protein P5218_15105, partial [Planctomycetota bacterium]|nr:hypothetical protein [Planctomycetota bacterium]